MNIETEKARDRVYEALLKSYRRNLVWSVLFLIPKGIVALVLFAVGFLIDALIKMCVFLVSVTGCIFWIMGLVFTGSSAYLLYSDIASSDGSPVNFGLRLSYVLLFFVGVLVFMMPSLIIKIDYLDIPLFFYGLAKGLSFFPKKPRRDELKFAENFGSASGPDISQNQFYSRGERGGGGGKSDGESPHVKYEYHYHMHGHDGSTEKADSGVGENLDKDMSGFSPFAGCDTLDKLDKRYRHLAKAYHPDVGSGDSDSMVHITLEYEKLKNELEKNAVS